MEGTCSSSNTSGHSDGDSDAGLGMASTQFTDDLSSDAEGVWSADIEQSFQEALAIYPPCGRRKIILQDEGKMYGRNELIARYIKLRTGKSRSRKQVSSHIQVLARRKTKEVQTHREPQIKDKVSMQNLIGITSTGHHLLSSSPIKGGSLVASLPPLPPSLLPSVTFGSDLYPANYPAHLWTVTQPLNNQDLKGSFMTAATGYSLPDVPLVIIPKSEYPQSNTPHLFKLQQQQQSQQINSQQLNVQQLNLQDQNLYVGRSIAGPCMRLVELSAFQELTDTEPIIRHLFVHIGGNDSLFDQMLETVDICQISDKFPNKKGGLKELYAKGPQSAFFLVKFWADINTGIPNNSGFYGISTLFESTSDMVIQCSTKVCSFGKQVVEKVETEYAHHENNHYVYRIHRSPMCEYLINFIHKLNTLPQKSMMNSVLENFTVLQVVVDRETQSTLLCIAYVFEISSTDHGAQHHIYRLVKEQT